MYDWKIIYGTWEPEEQPLREALCTLGDGYFATSGAFEEAEADEKQYCLNTYRLVEIIGWFLKL